ncbi:uncharacterized protein LOC105424750 [Pogonomyrmex barbatus]|uniref:Uncharacterized protein LOC105424750 n=1 Tax=Pogonomyrmex barbatus TaxID=144034 RepID=A0A8N1S641_9HYME|nr:uncharacterized protein LOC105424750 [Pogonomyrmex barbatus]
MKIVAGKKQKQIAKMFTNMFSLEKLRGRENFATWKFSIKTYLEHEDLWQCVEPSPGKNVDPAKDVKAKAKLILLLELHNYVHVQDCHTAKETWDSLQKAFDDSGLTRKVGFLKDLITTTLDSSNKKSTLARLLIPLISCGI